MNKTTITLKYPILIDGREVGQLKMRRPKVKDLTAVKSISNQEEKEKHLFANLCEVAPDNMEELDIADYFQLQEAYENFLSSPQNPVNS